MLVAAGGGCGGQPDFHVILSMARNGGGGNTTDRLCPVLILP